MGPGSYNMDDSAMNSFAGKINPIPPNQERIHGVDMTRPSKSQDQQKRKWVWDEKQNSKFPYFFKYQFVELVVKTDFERENVIERAKMNM